MKDKVQIEKLKEIVQDMAEDHKNMKQYCFYIFYGMLGSCLLIFGFVFLIFEFLAGWIAVIIGMVIEIIFIPKKIRLENKINRNTININKKIEETK